MKSVHKKTFLWLGLSALALTFTPQSLHACDACNIAFGQQMEGQRANSLIGQDFQKAIQNQQQLLSGSGLGSEAFQPTLLAQNTATTQAATPAVADAHNHADHNHANHNHSTAQPAAAATPAPASTAQPAAAAQATVAATPAPASTAQAAAATAQAPARALQNGPMPAANAFGGSYSRPYDKVPEEWANDPFIEVIKRDYGFSLPATSYVPQDTQPDKSFTITLSEGKTYIGNGVVYDGFLTNNSVPGPLIVVDEGDIVEFIVKNEGTVPHGASIHSAYTQTSKYLGKIGPGTSGRVVFRATQPGVYMYHCAPGGHAIPMHVMFGQYGMMVVKPKNTQYELERRTGHKPDIEIYMVQHEFYASGKDAVEGNAMYTMFNGRLFRYVEDPIKARPGDFVRIYFLNVGPNLLSTFHIVGIQWDFVHWQGNPEVVWPGGQTVTAGPSDSFVIDFRIPPDEGAYTILTHAVGSASRGAIGLIVAEKDIERDSLITPEAPALTAEQMAEIEAKATRTVSPYKITDYDKPTTFMPGTKKVDVSIIGNSFWPKVIEIEPGTEVTWTNEDVFTYLAGEFAGIHNAVGNNGEEEYFMTPLLAHGESASYVFENEGVFDYTCTPHPYMRGRIIVKKPEVDFSELVEGKSVDTGYLLPLVFAAFLIALFSLFRAKRPKDSTAAKNS